jgi:hypothetical protein
MTESIFTDTELTGTQVRLKHKPTREPVEVIFRGPRTMNTLKLTVQEALTLASQIERVAQAAIAEEETSNV